MKTDIYVKKEQIERLINTAEIHTKTFFDKTTLVIVKLENGFVISESSSCVDPKNYDEQIGIEICLGRIKNKLWELEGYKLQSKVWEENK